jgi:hypothetical protein
MSVQRWLAVVLVFLALVGCAQVATGPEPAPYSPGDNGNTRDKGGDGGMM